MGKNLTISFESGAIHDFVVKEAEFHVYPLVIPEGEVGAGQAHPRAGQLSSYKIDTAGVADDIDIIWFKLDKVESIILTKEIDNEGG